MTFDCANDKTDCLLAAADDIKIVKIQPRPSLEALRAKEHPTLSKLLVVYL